MGARAVTSTSDVLHLVTPNTVRVNELLKGDFLDLGAAGPGTLKSILKYHGLAAELFPGIVTGVTCWPFLCVARAPQRFKTVRKRIETLKKNGKCCHYGPGSRTGATTLPATYRSAWKEIKAQNSALTHFLQRTRFDGRPNVFRTSRQWRTALRQHVSADGKRFLDMIWKDKTGKRFDEVTPFGDVISGILKSRPKPNDRLYHAAFCYAFFNCVYGVKGEDTRRKAREIADTTWPKALLKGLGEGWLPVQIMSGVNHKLISWLEKANQEHKPPLLKVAQKATGEDRPVNFSARLYAVYRLYAHPTPKRLKKFVEAHHSS